MSGPIIERKVWYVLRVPPQAEFQVSDKLHVMGLSYLVPHEIKYTAKARDGGRKRYHKRRFPLYARYVCVGIAGNPDWHAIKAIEPGPVKPVQFNEHDGPAVLSEHEVECLASIRGGDLPAGFNLHRALKTGELARIASGHWAAGHTSAIQAIEGDQAKLQVTMLGAPRTVTIALSHLEAA